MDGVAAKVAEEVRVFFEEGDGDALARQKETEHDACGASADDAAGGFGGGWHRWEKGSRASMVRQKASMKMERRHTPGLKPSFFVDERPKAEPWGT